MDRTVFYDDVRHDHYLFGGKLNQGREDFKQALAKAIALV